MKKIVIFLALSLSIQISYAQISKIKKTLSELYFELNFPTTKYDLRKKIHGSENFKFSIEDNYNNRDIIGAEFNQNYKLSYASKAEERKFNSWFNEGSDINYCASIELQYSPENNSYATKQFNEVVGFFKGISFKANQFPNIKNGEKVGDHYYFHSSAKSYQDNLSYLVLQMDYLEFDNIKMYMVSITFYNGHLY